MADITSMASGNDWVNGEPRAREVEILSRAFARIDKVALGLATGAVVGAGVFLATAVLLVKGGPHPGPNLALLGQFFPGFRVTWPGSLVGLSYGFGAGFSAGWIVALSKNAFVASFLRQARLRSARRERRDRKSTRLNSSHIQKSRMPSSA